MLACCFIYQPYFDSAKYNIAVDSQAPHPSPRPESAFRTSHLCVAMRRGWGGGGELVCHANRREGNVRRAAVARRVLKRENSLSCCSGSPPDPSSSSPSASPCPPPLFLLGISYPISPLSANVVYLYSQAGEAPPLFLTDVR